jgi:hypothetical protein
VRTQREKRHIDWPSTVAGTATTMALMASTAQVFMHLFPSSAPGAWLARQGDTIFPASLLIAASFVVSLLASRKTDA